jgi:hypothetical protein
VVSPLQQYILEQGGFMGIASGFLKYKAVKKGISLLKKNFANKKR